MPASGTGAMEQIKAKYPEKFVSEHDVFGHIRRGDRIFLGTACGEPQHLVQALTDYVKAYQYIDANRERAMKVMIEL